jgi:hypothetical protein
MPCYHKDGFQIMSPKMRMTAMKAVQASANQIA